MTASFERIDAREIRDTRSTRAHGKAEFPPHFAQRNY